VPQIRQRLGVHVEVAADPDVNSSGKSVMQPSDRAYHGQEVYSSAFLRIYDPLILGFYGNVVWRCPTSRLVQHYRQHVGHQHLDVGPGIVSPARCKSEVA
jgi:hypothetical protein